ncbi:MAG: hypothetical protein ACYC3Q_11545 [Gemmatimonadaceae bacterium]
MDDPAKVLVAFGFFGTMAITIRSIANVLVARAQARLRGGDPLVEQRLARIEQAVEAVAVEVERISEGQRFTTRLLSERVNERLRESSGAPRQG